MFVGWEGVGLCSYLLIGYWFSDEEKASAGKKAFIVNRIGDLGFLLAIFLLVRGVRVGGLRGRVRRAREEIFEYGGPLVTAVTLFFLVAATGKSAQIPLYIWLPDAMAGPHARVGADPCGDHGHGRCVPGRAVLAALRACRRSASAAVAGIGVLTALVRRDHRTQTERHQERCWPTPPCPSWDTCFWESGSGPIPPGVFHLMTHAFFKALLFLGAGAVIHSMHHALHHTHKDWDAQDMRNMGGLRKYMPITWAHDGARHAGDRRDLAIRGFLQQGRDHLDDRRHGRGRKPLPTPVSIRSIG